MKPLPITFILLLAAGVATALAAEPALPNLSSRERIRDASFWHRLARHGDQAYLMAASPSQSEEQEARERGVPVTAVDGAAIAL